MLVRCFVIAGLLCIGSASQAAITTYNSFAGFSGGVLGTIGTENFDGFTGTNGPTPPAANSLTYNFGATGVTATASYTGTSYVNNWTTGSSPISAPNHLFVSNNVTPGSFTINFSAPISAIGFYVTDAGDIGPGGEENTPTNPTAGNPDDFTVTLSSGSTYAIPTSGNLSGTTNYFGIVDNMGSFNSVTLDHQFIGDLFVVDDISVVAFAPTGGGGAVPEPTSASIWACMLLGGLGFIRRRRN